MNQQSQTLQNQQNEELTYFTAKGLEVLVEQMGFQEVVQFDDKPKQMLIDIGNEFVNKLLEESVKASQRRQQNEDFKTNKPKLTVQDIKFALEHSLRIPQQNFTIDKDN